jgi:hypothetical protein
MRVFSRILDRYTEKNSGGELGYFGLTAWWSSTFSPAEQDYIETAFRTPELPAGVRPLTRDRCRQGFGTAAGLLSALADRLSERPEDRSLACRVLAKAEERAIAEDDVLGLHLTYHQMIRLHGRWKERFADSVDLAFAACHKQIRLAPHAVRAFREKLPDEPLPAHLGYQQAATLLEQQEAYAQAVEICRQAQSQGWPGNWSWRIQRMSRKMPYVVTPISPSGMGPV